jgi:hypothetical protein
MQHLANFDDICELQKYSTIRDNQVGKFDFKLTETWGLTVMKPNFLPLVEAELTALLPEWPRLVAQDGGWVACHSIIVVWLCVNDPLYLEMCPRD